MSAKHEFDVSGKGNVVAGGPQHIGTLNITNYGDAPPTDRGTGPLPRLQNIRFAPLREKFAGRQTLLTELAAQLQPGQSASLSQRAAIHADGGVGKTAVAVELAWRLFDAETFAYVFLLDATSPGTIESDLASLCERQWLNLPEQDGQEQDVRLQSVLRWLKTPANAGRTLLVLDGADSPESQEKVRALHQQLHACALFVTSRQPVGGGIPHRELELFSPEEAREFLHTRLHAAHLAGPDVNATLNGIAEAVDHLPLALEIVASYIRETHQTPEEWLHEWRTAPDDTLQHHNPADIAYPVSLSRVWEQSVARLSRGAREHLYAFAWLAPRPAAFPLETPTKTRKLVSNSAFVCRTSQSRPNPMARGK